MDADIESGDAPKDVVVFTLKSKLRKGVNREVNVNILSTQMYLRLLVKTYK